MLQPGPLAVVGDVLRFVVERLDDLSQGLGALKAGLRAPLGRRPSACLAATCLRSASMLDRLSMTEN